MKKKDNAKKKRKLAEDVLHRTITHQVPQSSFPSSTRSIAGKFRSLSVLVKDIRKDDGLHSQLGWESKGHGVWKCSPDMLQHTTRYFGRRKRTPKSEPNSESKSEPKSEPVKEIVAGEPKLTRRRSVDSVTVVTTPGLRKMDIDKRKRMNDESSLESEVVEIPEDQLTLNILEEQEESGIEESTVRNKGRQKRIRVNLLRQKVGPYGEMGWRVREGDSFHKNSSSGGDKLDSLAYISHKGSGKAEDKDLVSDIPRQRRGDKIKESPNEPTVSVPRKLRRGNTANISPDVLSSSSSSLPKERKIDKIMDSTKELEPLDLLVSASPQMRKSGRITGSSKELTPLTSPKPRRSITTTDDSSNVVTSKPFKHRRNKTAESISELMISNAHQQRNPRRFSLNSVSTRQSPKAVTSPSIRSPKIKDVIKPKIVKSEGQLERTLRSSKFANIRKARKSAGNMAARKADDSVLKQTKETRVKSVVTNPRKQQKNKKNEKKKVARTFKQEQNGIHVSGVRCKSRTKAAMRIPRKRSNKVQLEWCSYCGVQMDSVENRLEHEFSHQEHRRLQVSLHRCNLNTTSVKLPVYVNLEEVAALKSPQEEVYTSDLVDSRPLLNVENVLNEEEYEAYDELSDSKTDEDCKQEEGKPDKSTDVSFELNTSVSEESQMKRSFSRKAKEKAHVKMRLWVKSQPRNTRSSKLQKSPIVKKEPNVEECSDVMTAGFISDDVVTTPQENGLHDYVEVVVDKESHGRVTADDETIKDADVSIPDQVHSEVSKTSCDLPPTCDNELKIRAEDMENSVMAEVGAVACPESTSVLEDEAQVNQQDDVSEDVKKNKAGECSILETVNQDSEKSPEFENAELVAVNEGDENGNTAKEEILASTENEAKKSGEDLGNDPAKKKAENREEGNYSEVVEDAPLPLENSDVNSNEIGSEIGDNICLEEGLLENESEKSGGSVKLDDGIMQDIVENLDLNSGEVDNDEIMGNLDPNMNEVSNVNDEDMGNLDPNMDKVSNEIDEDDIRNLDPKLSEVNNDNVEDDIENLEPNLSEVNSVNIDDDMKNLDTNLSEVNDESVEDDMVNLDPNMSEVINDNVGVEMENTEVDNGKVKNEAENFDLKLKEVNDNAVEKEIENLDRKLAEASDDRVEDEVETLVSDLTEVFSNKIEDDIENLDRKLDEVSNEEIEKEAENLDLAEESSNKVEDEVEKLHQDLNDVSNDKVEDEVEKSHQDLNEVSNDKVEDGVEKLHQDLDEVSNDEVEDEVEKLHQDLDEISNDKVEDKVEKLHLDLDEVSNDKVEDGVEKLHQDLDEVSNDEVEDEVEKLHQDLNEVSNDKVEDGVEKLHQDLDEVSNDEVEDEVEKLHQDLDEVSNDKVEDKVEKLHQNLDEVSNDKIEDDIEKLHEDLNEVSNDKVKDKVEKLHEDLDEVSNDTVENEVEKLHQDLDEVSNDKVEDEVETLHEDLDEVSNDKVEDEVEELHQDLDEVSNDKIEKLHEDVNKVCNDKVEDEMEKFHHDLDEVSNDTVEDEVKKLHQEFGEVSNDKVENEMKKMHQDLDEVNNDKVEEVVENLDLDLTEVSNVNTEDRVEILHENLAKVNYMKVKKMDSDLTEVSNNILVDEVRNFNSELLKVNNDNLGDDAENSNRKLKMVVSKSDSEHDGLEDISDGEFEPVDERGINEEDNGETGSDAGMDSKKLIKSVEAVLVEGRKDMIDSMEVDDNSKIVEVDAIKVEVGAIKIEVDEEVGEEIDEDDDDDRDTVILEHGNKGTFKAEDSVGRLEDCIGTENIDEESKDGDQKEEELGLTVEKGEKSEEIGVVEIDKIDGKRGETMDDTLAADANLMVESVETEEDNCIRGVSASSDTVETKASDKGFNSCAVINGDSKPKQFENDNVVKSINRFDGDKEKIPECEARRDFDEEKMAVCCQ